MKQTFLGVRRYMGYVAVLSTGVVGLLWTAKAHAALPSQLIDNISETNLAGSCQYLGTGLSGSFDQLNLKLQQTNHIDQLTANIYQYSDTTYNTLEGFIANFTRLGEISSTSSEIVSFTNSSGTFLPNKAYVISLRATGAGLCGRGDCFMQFGSNSISSYPNGFFTKPSRYECSYPESSNTNIKNAYFQFLDTAEKEPVIIVPGIMGSFLNRVSDGQEFWPDVIEMRNSISDNYLDNLKLNMEGEQYNDQIMYAPDVIREVSALSPLPILKYSYLKNLIEKLKAIGYIENRNLFLMPYDWRLDISSESERIANRINAIAGGSQNGKVNVIAHSLGGLLIKDYLSKATSTLVNKIIFVGTPHLGAPKAFKILRDGDDLGMSKAGIGLNRDRVKEIIQNMPALYELLPSQKYFNIVGYVQDSRMPIIGLLKYADTKTLMQNDGRNPTLLARAERLHASLDNENLGNLSITNIVGCQNPSTLGIYRINQDGHHDFLGINGDGTVPAMSALDVDGSSGNFFVRYDQTGIDHQGLVVDDRTVNLITEIVSGKSPTLSRGIFTSREVCFTVPEQFSGETTISVSTYSPVALHAYDSEGRHTGILPDGNFEIGIPESQYEKIGESNFIFVPAGHEYKFVVDGLNSGKFDLKVRKYKGSNLGESVTYLNVPVEGNQTNAELLITNNNPSNLKVDEDGNGDFEASIPPTAILSATSSIDITPPTAIISSPQRKDYLRSQIISINTTTTDTESGVAFTEIRPNGTITTSTVIDPFFGRLGTSTLSVHSVDRAGNPANAEIVFRVVANPQSTINDLERSFRLGWVTDRAVKDSLVALLKSSIRAQGQKPDKNAINLFSSQLQSEYSRGIISQSAFDILKEDGEWIINN